MEEYCEYECLDEVDYCNYEYLHEDEAACEIER